MRKIVFALLFCFTASTLLAQRMGEIRGYVRDKKTQEPLVGVSVVVENTTNGTVTDVDGNYTLSVAVGAHNVKATYVGYKALTQFNIDVTTGNAQSVNFELTEDLGELKEVVVSGNRTIRATSVATPNSVQRLGVQEIKSTPGGNFDVFKVVQTLPGVGNTPGVGNRNDIIVRGGAPSENVYYLDGIEIPAINHFGTQGSGGGSNGILNVSFVEELTLNSSAFDARYDNALSSVFQFKQRDGNSERTQGNLRLSATELAATIEGPINSKTTYLASVRRSYLEVLFKLIDLPIRPNYWDFQYKVSHKFNNKTSLTFIGVGAIDDFFTDVAQKSTPEKIYIAKSAPTIDQWNYTTGVALKHLMDKGILNIALSRNMSDNKFRKFEDGLRTDASKLLSNSESQEIENKLRADMTQFVGDWTISYGISGQFVKYNNAYNAIVRKEIRDSLNRTVQPAVNVNFNSAFDMWRFGAFGQFSRRFLDNKLGLSMGIRTDLNSFTDNGSNPLPAFSPRLSLSYDISDKWKINASLGQYAKLPAYTVLGFKNNAGIFTNRDAKYINSTHYVAGLEFIPRESTRMTLEGFFKTYNNYPVSTLNGISLANQGSDFGAVGNEDVVSNGKGQSVGFEVFFQQKLTKNIFAFLSYTYVVSKFSGRDGKLIPSAWDNRHLLSATLGRKFKKGWEMGLKLRFAGGTPYTPLDLTASRLNYIAFGRGELDYSRINTERLPAFKQFDFRLDKKINFRKTTLDLYFDVTNAFVVKNYAPPQYVFERTADNTAFKTTDGKTLAADASNAIPKVISDPSASVIPTIGFILEF
jgi:outer membrane receptor for ferrienterochelin and colicin